MIGLSLAMEDMFAFFAESASLGLFLFGEKKLGPRGHFAAGFMVFFGSWLSGYFIVATNALMQHPVGHAVDPQGRLVLVDVWSYLFNAWAFWEYAKGTSPHVSAGSIAFSTIGFMGLYTLRGLLLVFLVGRAIARGPLPAAAGGSS